MTIFDSEPDLLGRTFDEDYAPTASLLEALEADYTRDRLTFQYESNNTANRNYWLPILDRIEEVTGQRPERPDIELNVEYDALDRFANRFGLLSDSYSTSVEKINALIGQYPELENELGVLSADQHISATQQLALDAEQRAEKQGRTALGEVFGFIGSLGADARLMVQDPAYGAMNVMGGVVRKPGEMAIKNIGRIALFEGLLNAGIEVQGSPSVAAWRDSIGLEYDAGTFAAAVGTGFLGGTAFGGAIATPLEIAARRLETPLGLYARELNQSIDETSLVELDRRLQSLSDREVAAGLRALEEAGVELPAVARGAQEEIQAQEDLFDDNPLEDAELEHMQRTLEAEAVISDSDNVRPLVNAPAAPPRQQDIHHADNLDATIFRFEPNDIEVDAQTFQFKMGGDEFGVTERLQGITQWDPVKAGQIVVYEFANGRRVIADGHQRLGLAKRIMAQDPSQKPVIYGNLLRESDGITPEQARVIAAMKNIAEGSGTAIDAAKVLRVEPGRIGELPPRSNLVRQARDLVGLSDEAFGAVVNEVVPANYAAIVGRLVADQDRQLPIMQLLAEAEPTNTVQAEAIVRQALEAEFDTAVQVGLFGEELITTSLFKERARVLDAALKQLRRDRAVFNSLVENRARIEGEGNVLAAAQNQSRSETDGQAIQIVQAVANRRGELSDALTAAARDFKESGNISRSSRGFVDAVREAVERGDFNGADAGDAGRTVDVAEEGNRLAASPSREELAAFDEPDGPAVKQQADQLERDYVGAEPREAQQPDVAMRQDLQERIDAGATRDEIDAHPAIIDALQQAAAIPETRNEPGYLDADWLANREFIFGDETVIGYDAGVQRLYDNARGLGWTDDGLEFPGTINQDRRATIILGPPAAGKSTFANKFAQARNAAIIDPDEAKKVLPEYEGGIGANAVHAESAEIADAVLAMALVNGDNVVIPRTGGKLETVAEIFEQLELMGYEIDLVLMDVSIDNAHKRMIGRFIGTGRLINPQVIYDIGDNPQITYNALKGRAKRHGEIDNNGAPDAPFPTRDTSADNPFTGVELRLRDAATGVVEALDSEVTGAGQQTLIPGVEPVTDAQRAQLEVDRPLRGGDAPMNVGLFDTDAQAQSDLLDFVPLTREAADGTPVVDNVSKRQLLDEIEQDQRMLDRFEGCVA